LFSKTPDTFVFPLDKAGSNFSFAVFNRIQEFNIYTSHIDCFTVCEHLGSNTNSNNSKISYIHEII